jgi:hypothetical protein
VEDVRARPVSRSSVAQGVAATLSATKMNKPSNSQSRSILFQLPQEPRFEYESNPAKPMDRA